MARVRLHLFFVFGSFHLSSAHSSSSEKGRLEVEIGREGQVLMRQGGAKVQTIESAEQHLDVQVGKPRLARLPSIYRPHNIDDSWFGSSMRVLSFVQKKYPYFYASSFVGASVMLLLGVCFYVQHEDYREAQIRARIRRAYDICNRRNKMQAMKAASTLGPAASADLKAKAEAAAAAAAVKRPDMRARSDAGLYDVAFSEAAVPVAAFSDTTHSVRSQDRKKQEQEAKDFENFKPKDAMARHMEKAAKVMKQDTRARTDAEAAFSAAARSMAARSIRSTVARSDGVRSAGARASSARFRQASPPLRGPRAMVGQAAAASAHIIQQRQEQGVQGMLKLSDAVGNFTGVLAGENTKMPKFSSPFASASLTDATTASGNSTPRSQLSSQQASLGSEVNCPAIRSGTVLVTRLPEVIFASTTSWQEIGELSPGQKVMAAAPPERIAGYMMVPIEPRGAVDLKTFRVQHEY